MNFVGHPALAAALGRLGGGGENGEGFAFGLRGVLGELICYWSEQQSDKKGTNKKQKLVHMQGGGNVPIATKSCLTLTAVLADVSRWRMPFSSAYPCASCATRRNTPKC